MQAEEIAACLEALIAAPRPADALEILATHADAFRSESVLKVLDADIERCADDADRAQLLRHRRLIVAEFHRGGLDAARAVIERDSGIASLLEDWLACDGWDSAFRFMEQNSQLLLSPAAGSMIAALAARYADDPAGGPKLNAYSALAAMARESGLTEARRWLCHQLLKQLNQTSVPAERAAYYPTLLALTDKDAERDEWIAHNVSFGSLLRGLDRPLEAIERFQAALEVVTPEGAPEHYSGIHRSLGNVYFGSNCRDKEKAEFHFNEALRTLPAGDAANLLHIHHMLGLLHVSGNRPTQAMEHLRKALSVPPEASPDQWMQVSADLADALMQEHGQSRQATLVEAVERLETAIGHLDRETDAERYARAHRNLGMAYRDIESTDRTRCLELAIAHTEAALAVWSRQRDAYRWAQLEHNLGTIYYLRRTGDAYDNLMQAADHYEHALTVHTRQRHPRDWALTTAALGMCFIALYTLTADAARLDTAVATIGETVAWWTDHELPDADEGRHLHAEAENALGGALIERAALSGRKDLESGIEHLRVAESIYAKLRMTERLRAVRMNLAQAFSSLAELDRDAFPRAVTAAKRAIDATPRATDAYTWAVFQRNYAAILANSGRAELRSEAIESLEGALDVFSRERFAADHSRTQGFLGHVHFLNRDWERALAAYRSAVDTTDEIVRTAYTEAGQDNEIAATSLYYMRAAFCLLELGRAGESLVMLDRGKGRALSLDMAAGATLGAAEGTGSPLDQAHREVARLEAEMRLPPLRPGRRSDAEIGSALRKSRQRLADLLAADGITVRADLDLAEILAAAPAGGALAALLVTSAGSAAFVVPDATTTLGDEHVVRSGFSTDDLHGLLIGNDTDPGLLRTYLRLRYASDNDTFAALAQTYRKQLRTGCARLWDELFAAVYDRLRTFDLPRGAPLRLIPQGGLGMLPLHAVCDETQGRGEPGHWPLLEQFAVSYAPSAYLSAAAAGNVAARDKDGGPAPTLFAAINPTNDLPFAETEGSLIAELFTEHSGGDSVTVLKGIGATVRNVRPHLSQASYLHFACHGSFNFREPARSALHFAGGQPLELAELMGPGFDFSSCRLVALSACETGIAEFQRSPDEYIGLPATFLRAGAPTVLSTLWEVNDISSALLINQFYRHHIGAGASPAQALREAQLWLAQAAKDEIADWIGSAQATLRARNPGNSRVSASVLDRLESARQQIAGGALGSIPFQDPWYWAAYSLTGV